MVVGGGKWPGAEKRCRFNDVIIFQTRGIVVIYLVRWAGNPPSLPLQSHASRSEHMPPFPFLFPLPPSFFRAPETLPIRHGTSPNDYVAKTDR